MGCLLDAIQVFLQYKDIVPNIARKYSRNNNYYEDLLMTGYLTILEVLNTEKANKIYIENPDKLSHYLSMVVKFRLLSYIRKEKYGLDFTKKDRKLLKKIEKEETSGLKSKDFTVYNHLYWAKNGGSLSIDAQLGEDNCGFDIPDEFNLSEFVEQSHENSEIIDIIESVLDKQSDSKRQIYMEWMQTVLHKDYTINQASEKVGVSRQYFNRIVNDINEKVKNELLHQRYSF